MPLQVSAETTDLMPPLLSPATAITSPSFGHDLFAPHIYTENRRHGLVAGLKRRLRRERRRRKVGRAYDMALEIARLVPHGSRVLDVGCGNGFIAHHLSAIMGQPVIGIDVTETTESAVDYRPFDGTHFPALEGSVDVVLLCYVLHHAQDVQAVVNEVRRVLRTGGLVLIYEDIPATAWDRAICWIHNRQWQPRTGPCTFRNLEAWRILFHSHGFEILRERQLARARNFTHPVSRRLYLLSRSASALT